MMNHANPPALLEITDDVQSKWQNIIDIMAKIINVPSGLIMRIVDRDISVFLSSQTENNPYKPGDKEVLKNSGLYCETVINTQKKLLVPDALSDEHWKNNPDVKLNMISYLGFPINLPNNKPFGTICILDNKMNAYSDLYVDLIKSFREIIEKDIDLLYMNQILGETNKKLSDYLSEIYTLRGILPICARCKKIRDSKGYWNRLEDYFQKHSELKFSHGYCEDCAKELYGHETWFREKDLS